MPETPDPRDTCGAITEAVGLVMETVGQMTVMASVPGSMKLVYEPTEGQSFTVNGRPKDRPYVAEAMGEIKVERIDTAKALALALIDQLEALRPNG